MPTSALPANVHLRCVSSNYYEDRSIAPRSLECRRAALKQARSHSGDVEFRCSVFISAGGQSFEQAKTEAGGSTALITTSRLSCRKRPGTTAPCHSASVRHGRHRSRRKRRSDTRLMLWETAPGKHRRLGPESVSGSAFRVTVSDWQRREEPFGGGGPPVRIWFPLPVSSSRQRVCRHAEGGLLPLGFAPLSYVAIAELADPLAAWPAC